VSSVGHAAFDWTVWTAEWEPRGRPKPPFGPTALEVMRSCPLRRCFEESPGYEPRLHFAVRLGIAFHRTLESLNRLDDPGLAGAMLSEWAMAKFADELGEQIAEANGRPRERLLPRSEARQSAATEALLQTAHRLARTVRTGHQGGVPASAHASPAVEVEVAVSSHDGLFTGYVDRAEHTFEGTRLLDFKSAIRDDLHDRYKRQLQLYAFMWRETRGEWPYAADVVYPLAGSVCPVGIAPELCEAVAAECVALVSEVTGARRPADLGRPGEACRWCPFRPWCEPFWEMQSPSSNPLAADRGDLGLEGQVETRERKGEIVKVVIRWGAARVELVSTDARFPQLAHVLPGERVRLLDAELRGMRHHPRVRVTEFTELFRVDPVSG
jgi:RecB family exonuclease